MVCSEEIIRRDNRNEKGMFVKGHKHTEEVKIKLRGKHSPGEFKKRHIFSKETLQKNSESHKGKVPANKAKYPKIPTLCLCGCNNAVWNGRKWINGHNPQKNRGMKTPEGRKKISKANKGRTPWNNGKPWDDGTKAKMSKSRKGRFKGKENINWNGGTSFLPYCHKFNEQLKEQIRERDNRTCQLCGEKENGRKLSVHHIHYDKPNCEPDLITLCIRCNGKVNKNRDYYEELFMNKTTPRK